MEKSRRFHKNQFIAVETHCNALTERQRRKKNHRKLHVRAAISSGVCSSGKQHKGYTWLLFLFISISSHTFSQSNKVLVYGLFSTCEYHLMIVNDISCRGFNMKGLLQLILIVVIYFFRIITALENVLPQFLWSSSAAHKAKKLT